MNMVQLKVSPPIDILEAIAGEFPDEDELDAAAESLEDGSLILEVQPIFAMYRFYLVVT